MARLFDAVQSLGLDLGMTFDIGNWHWTGECPLQAAGAGPRVPMYVISPWSKGGWVDSQLFDHTSVGRFIEKRFGVTIPAITPWARAVCGDLTTAFDFAHPNDPRVPALPDMSDYAAAEAKSKLLPAVTAPATPLPLYQERGVRFSRALPYELQVTARIREPGAPPRSNSASRTRTRSARSFTCTTSWTSARSRAATRSRRASGSATIGSPRTMVPMTCGCSARTASIVISSATRSASRRRRRRTRKSTWRTTCEASN
jgi:Phosphoesterase family